MNTVISDVIEEIEERVGAEAVMVDGEHEGEVTPDYAFDVHPNRLSRAVIALTEQPDDAGWRRLKSDPSVARATSPYSKAGPVVWFEREEDDA